MNYEERLQQYVATWTNYWEAKQEANEAIKRQERAAEEMSDLANGFSFSGGEAKYVHQNGETFRLTYSEGRVMVQKLTVIGQPEPEPGATPPVHLNERQTFFCGRVIDWNPEDREVRLKNHGNWLKWDQSFDPTIGMWAAFIAVDGLWKLCTTRESMLDKGDADDTDS